MEIDKSPGIDGLTSNFYKHFWPLIGPDVTKVFNHSFKHGLLTRSQRRGIITLVFKKGDRSKLQNWRPITLLNTDYKILTKALAIRLTNVLPNIIHSDQTACIPGRTINDNLSLIRDVIDYANETDTPLALISIDQMKAFDRTSHSFLFATLKRFGFGPNFIRWIEVIYNSVSSSVNVNGWLTAFINLERGLRQGCALSMPLYVLTAEILALRIRANPRIQGITPPGSTAQVKLSQYADDTTFTLRDDVSIQETFNLLTLYEAASGAKINLDKCKGLWSGSLKHRTDQLLNFSCYNTYIPEKILGTFFGNTDCTRLNLDRRLQSLRNTIAAWKHRDLSFKGKALVINGLLTSTLWYTLTSVHLPPWAVTELETEIYNFFWDYKKPLTTRDIIALPLAEGGFNVHRLQTKLYALRLNTLRRLISPEPAHWKHFMTYFLRLNSLKLGIHTLTLAYKPQDIDPTTPPYHRELLIAWHKYSSLLTRHSDPVSLQAILQEPLFCNPLITLANKPLRFPQWISAGLTRIQDICYLAIPGFLPPPAIHELLNTSTDVDLYPLSRTTREFEQLLQAIPPTWKTLILRHTAPVNSTPTLHFSILGPRSPAPQLLERHITRAFYLDLLHLSPPTIPALQQWSTSLLPQPVFNAAFWKNIYTPLSANKHCDITWKIAHRNLPTALSLYRMAVHPTTLCPYCNSVETIEHLLLQCPHLLTFWSTIGEYIDKITGKTLTLNPTLQLFGYIRKKNDQLGNRAAHLLNWAMTLARYSIHKSATEHRLRSNFIDPISLFRATVKAHLTFQFRLAKLRHTVYYFPFDWCIGEAFARLTHGTLVFTM